MSNGNVYILGDNINALALIVESIASIYGIGQNIQIVINRPFAYQSQDFNAGLVEFSLINSDDFNPTPYDLIYIAGMSGQSRHFLAQYYSSKIGNILLPTLIHPSANVAKNVTIGSGTRVEQSAILAPLSKIGELCLLNRGSIIGHHTVISDYVNINPGAIVNGNCTIGSFTTIGSGAIINDGVTIGHNTIIGAGAVVTKDIGDGIVAYGSPAKEIRKNI